VSRRRRAVVTGVAGFIGSNLAERLLAEDFEVVGVDNLAYGVLEQVPSGVQFHREDIRGDALEPLFRGSNVVYHLAAKNCIADCQADPVETADINVTGTVKVFEAARRAQVAKVVYAESSALYEGVARMPTPEDEVRPESFYAVSKLAGRVFADAYRRWSTMRMTALRYFCVYGPRQDYRRTIPPVMSAFIIRLLKGERPVIFGSGKKRRDFIYVDDVNDFHLLCASDARTDGGTYNVGSGVSYSVHDIFDRVRGLLGATAEPEYRPDLLGEADETLADIAAARALGWEPRVDLTTGLSRSIAFIREHVVPATAQPTAR
jgi:nucleoside-diphosphate-sugar epimerase